MRDDGLGFVERVLDRVHEWLLDHGGRTITGLDDRELRIPHVSPVCIYCRHVKRFRRCAAFKGEIPLEIWLGKNTHQQPYPGDHGIQFEPVPGAKVTTPQVTRE